MKKRFTWLQVTNALLSAILMLLGFSACDNNVFKGGEEPCMYGTPSAHYELKGKVIDKEKQPLPGMQIIVKGIMEVWPQHVDTLYTDRKGEFLHKESVFPGTNYWVIHRDLRNAEIVYKTDSVWVEMPEPSGSSDGWFYGNSVKEITIELTEKKENEE